MTNKPFAKTQALGNDFLIYSVADVRAIDAPGEIARRMCDRQYGAGADGLVFFNRSEGQAPGAVSRIFNADGSEAEISGNGTRCLAAYLYFAGICSDPDVEIATAAGIKRGKMLSREGSRYEFEFEMGEPRLSASDIPLTLGRDLERVVGYSLKVGGKEFEVTCVSMGNPHCTLFWTGPEEPDVSEIGSQIETHPIFPNRTNVEFVRIISEKEIEVAFWERGVGRTLSSGTGSSAAAIAAILNGLTGRSVQVNTAGGNLYVNWRGDNIVTLTGWAEVVYEGQWLRE